MQPSLRRTWVLSRCLSNQVVFTTVFSTSPTRPKSCITPIKSCIQNVCETCRVPIDQSEPPPAADLAEPPRDGGPREAAFHIKDAIQELSMLARAQRLDMLAYLLDMAHLEAEEAVRRVPADPG